MNNNQKLYYGGLAEFVPSPTTLTYSFFCHWFMGENSVGKAMQLLHLPYQPYALPLIVLKDDHVYIHGVNEEKTLYEKTIFHYKTKPINSPVALTISPKKLISFTNIANTIKIIMQQSRWLADPLQLEKMATRFIENISETDVGNTIHDEETTLIEHVWPPILAVGMIAEYFHAYVEKEAGDDSADIMHYVAAEIAKNDWFFNSLTDQKKVADGRLSFEKYIALYGNRSDKDYELAFPRWHEIRPEIRQRIVTENISQVTKQQTTIPPRLQKAVHALIVLQQLRSEGKRKALIHINVFRQLLLKKFGEKTDMSLLTREMVLGEDNVTVQKPQVKKVLEKNTVGTYPKKGQGRSVSQGSATGIVKNITDQMMTLPKDTIGIFPNASPEYAQQFPKCNGMIFLQGGQTSHGAIVAREFGIPALIDSEAMIPDGKMVRINGATGEWKVVELT